MTKIIYFQNSKKIEKEVEEIPQIKYKRTTSTTPNKDFEQTWNNAIEL